MNLHHDKNAFEELVTAASVELKIPAPIIEKDYYALPVYTTLFITHDVIHPDIFHLFLLFFRDKF